MKFTALLLTVMLSFQMQAQQSILNPDRYLNLNYDNDFFSGTDRYYTQGIKIELIAGIAKKIPSSKILLRLPGTTMNYYGLALEQDGFTPRSIRKDSIQYGERPYCGSFFLSNNLISMNKEMKIRLNTQIDLGMIGPAAKGEEEQTAIHKAIGGLEPLGWQYQVKNDLILNYRTGVEKGLFSNSYFDLMAISEAKVGTMYDDLSGGIFLRLGLKHDYFANLGTSRTYLSKRFADRMQCYVFAKGIAKAVLYNATLQGGLFSKNDPYTLPASAIKRGVALAYTGAVLSFGRVKLEYTKAFLSPEFTKGLSHKWGHCNLSICF